MNEKRIINAWAMFDWANSVYALVIMTAIFPIYYLEVADDVIPVFGLQLSDSGLFAYSVSVSYIFIALFSPALSGIADYGGKKKFFLRFFTTIGGFACISMFFFQESSDVYFGTLAFMLATVGYAGGLVFYNAYLPLITTPDRYDYVSAKGFSYGYVGSLIALILCLIMIRQFHWFGFSGEGQATQYSFILIGLWWLGFAQITFFRLPPDEKGKKNWSVVGKGFQELKKVWDHVRVAPNIKHFLAAFFCYSAGAQTVFFLATAFAEKELTLGTTELIMTILLVQFVGIAGAYFFAFVSKKKGNVFSLVSMLFIWMLICVMAYFIQRNWEFYIVSALVGLVMGGIQSMSRSTYSKLFPKDTEETTSYFSFYDVLEKLSIVLGTFSFGFIEQITGSMRNSLLALMLFFVVGLFFLWRVRVGE